MTVQVATNVLTDLNFIQIKDNDRDGFLSSGDDLADCRAYRLTAQDLLNHDNLARVLESVSCRKKIQFSDDQFLLFSGKDTLELEGILNLTKKVRIPRQTKPAFENMERLKNRISIKESACSTSQQKNECQKQWQDKRAQLIKSAEEYNNATTSYNLIDQELQNDFSTGVIAKESLAVFLSSLKKMFKLRESHQDLRKRYLDETSSSYPQDQEQIFWGER